MILHRFVIGVTFNDRVFRIQSISGLLIDEILSKCKDKKKNKNDFFTQVSQTQFNNNGFQISLINDNKSNALTIQHNQFVYTKTSPDNNSSISVDKVIEEFEELWKVANKIVNFPTTRRIGFVGEHRIDGKDQSENGKHLIKSLTKFKTPENSGAFKLIYENRGLNKDGNKPLDATDEFWNSIFTFYTSESDETPEKGKINANIDVQKYYNPAKLDPLKELKSFKLRYREEKKKFKNQLLDLELIK